MKVAVYVGSRIVFNQTRKRSRFSWGEGYDEDTYDIEREAHYVCVYADEIPSIQLLINPIFHTPYYNPVSSGMLTSGPNGETIPSYENLQYDHSMTMRIISEIRSNYNRENIKIEIVPEQNDGTFKPIWTCIGIKETIH